MSPFAANCADFFNFNAENDRIVRLLISISSINIPSFNLNTNYLWKLELLNAIKIYTMY